MLGEGPSNLERRLWKAGKALGWSPFDPRLQALTDPQLDWAILMEDPDRRTSWRDERLTARDIAAVDLMEWFRAHITR
jgi:hypothetical protein